MVNRVVIIDGDWAGDNVLFFDRAKAQTGISGLAGGTYVVTNTSTSGVQNVPEPNFYELTITYDPVSSPTVEVVTNGAGRIYYNVTTTMTQTASEVISHTAQVEEAYGVLNTDIGPATLVLPEFESNDPLFLHMVLVGATDNTPISRVASTMLQIGNTSNAAEFSFINGTATEHNYTDADGTWRAYEVKDNVRIRVTKAGEIDLEVIGGGGQGGGLRNYIATGGGGAGGYKRRTILVSVGEYDIVVGKGGMSLVAPMANGSGSSAFGIAVDGGGNGGSTSTPTNNPPHAAAGDGASGGGAHGETGSRVGIGHGIDGFGGGSGEPNVGGGGGGAGGKGGNAQANPNRGGAGGLGVVTTILGIEERVCGGGAGAVIHYDSDTTQTAGDFGGGSASNTNATAVMDAKTFGAGGAGVRGTGTPVRGGFGYQGRVAWRVKVAA